MPSLTTQQIDAADDTKTLVKLLIDAGKEVPPRLRERILTFGPEAVPELLDMMQDEELSLDTAPGEGWAPIHAVDLLAELRAEAAVEPMLRLLLETDWDLIIHDHLIRELPKLGPAVLEPALTAYAETTDPDRRRALTHLLSGLKVHDDRAFEILAAALKENPELGAMSFAEYGDPRALPLLSAALDQYEGVLTDDWWANHALIELQAAIEELGGELTPEQRQKVDRILAPSEAKRRQFVAAMERAAGHADLETSPVRGALAPGGRAARAARKVGRNDPCPCGSGKKYKKCCLGKS
jgi:SEC-C motif